MGCSYCGPRGMVCLGKCSQPLQPWTVFSDEDAGIAELFELAKDVPATAQEATPTIQQLELSSDEQAPPFWPTVTMKRDPDRLGLFDLPPELRTQIYSYISQHIQSLYDDEGRDRLTDDLLRVSTCWTQDRFVALMKRNARFVKMQLVSRQVREEILGTWAEEVVHYGRLRFDIWQEQCRWDFRSLQQLPYAIWSATREVLEKLNDRFGVARYVRHVKLVARFEAKSHGEGPAELLARFDSNGIARQLDHFDAAFAHPDLVVELAVVCTHGQDGMESEADDGLYDEPSRESEKWQAFRG
ncbi:hypothetical protein B0A55_10458 [Friedmanniomyces simplex]|uniref:F-box domain-containing protein n=1 Tax=Friedmanniomyces simplex TaxID=329884 RepID=A0A4U0WGJ9_9PEZI|nr:hypothetical protein B0A55_10458 [Friedmanniomyces simplex]